jgi:hypothetical protein
LTKENLAGVDSTSITKFVATIFFQPRFRVGRRQAIFGVGF